MSMDHTNDQSESLFVGTPVWERSGKKRRSFGASKPVSRPAFTADSTPSAIEASRGEPAPAMRRAPARKQSSAATASAIALGVIVVAGAGAAGWYAMQDRDTGVAQLTPGEPATAGATQVAANTAVPPPTVAPTPAATPTERATAPSRAAARVRPAAAAPTGDTVDTSATLPEGPVPYAQSGSDAARMAPTPAPTAIPSEPVKIEPPAAAAAPAATEAVPPAETPAVAVPPQ